MLLQHKKELRRLASKNIATAANGTTSRPPQPHLLPHQRPPQQMDQLQPIQPQQPAPWTITNQQNYPGHHQHHYFPTYSCGNCHDSYSMTMHNCNELQPNTPPPQLYSNYFGTSRQQPQYGIGVETETSVSTTESELSCLQKSHLEQTVSDNFSNCENSGDDMLVDNYEQQSPSKNKNNNNNTSRSSFQFKKFPKQMRCSSPPPMTNPSSTETIPVTTPTPTLKAMAVKLLRNCCFSASETSTGLTINNNNNKNMNRKPYNETQLPTILDQSLETLLKRLSGNQETALLKAVKSRTDTTSTVSADCILIRRGLILNEEPYVVAYRLFFWAHLKNATQLKRLPVCLNNRDPVYVCCNPLHWCRILDTETAPPPYQQRSEMERLKTEDTVSGENSQNGGNSITASIGSSISSNSIIKSDLRVRIPESQSTDGEDRGSYLSPEWCQVSYWEGVHHIGDFYKVKKPSINIYAEGPCSGGIGEQMCLKDLIAKNPKESAEDVQHTRQKIGLGVTLSQEADGVWLYNRSTVPIFVHSPTLSENYPRICKVMPGDCLKAFDSHRARTIEYPSNYGGVQPGPVHKFSMQISFAKGWGRNYKRQDIIKCPCRLEVFFPQR